MKEAIVSLCEFEKGVCYHEVVREDSGDMVAEALGRQRMGWITIAVCYSGVVMLSQPAKVRGQGVPRLCGAFVLSAKKKFKNFHPELQNRKT